MNVPAVSVQGSNFRESNCLLGVHLFSFFFGGLLELHTRALVKTLEHRSSQKAFIFHSPHSVILA